MSHTPQAQTAIRKFARTTVDVDAITMFDLSEPASQDRKPVIRVTVKASQPASKGPATLKAWVFSLLDADPTLNGEKLAGITKAPSNTMQIYRREYFVQHPEKKPVTASREVGKSQQAIRALLDQNPDYTPSQLHKHVNISLVRVRQIYNQIKASQPV